MLKTNQFNICKDLGVIAEEENLKITASICLIPLRATYQVFEGDTLVYVGTSLENAVRQFNTYLLVGV